MPIRYSYKIKLYYDVNKENLLFSRNYDSIKNLLKDFNIPKTFLGKCFSENYVENLYILVFKYLESIN